MALGPKIPEQIARLRADLRIGLPILLRDGAEMALALATETLSAERLADLRALGGPITVAVTARRAETLRARAYDGDLARILLPKDASLPKEDLIAPLSASMKRRVFSSRGNWPKAAPMTA